MPTSSWIRPIRTRMTPVNQSDPMFHLGNPDLILTVCPRITNADPYGMVQVLDGAVRRLLYQVYGSKWKRLHSPALVLNPEFESRRTIGSRHQFLHYHGCVWSKSPKIIDRFKSGGFLETLRQTIAESYETDSSWSPSVHCESFDAERGDWNAYTRKNFSPRRDFTNEDAYVFGHRRRKKSNSVA